ncbi:MAG: hypothetical protein JO055_04330 [Alphaproteobacteria bacterium]|nr:hypothetical protein [Alphaproteobacteria bacterium]
MQTISHVYDSYGQASAVVKDLESAGIPSTDISMIANKYVSQRYADVNDASATSAGAGIGAGIGGAAGLLAGLGLMAIPGLGPVVAAGWLASTAVGAVAGGAAGAGVGGIVDAIKDSGVPEEHAHVYAETIRRGGTMVTARVADSQIAAANAIFARHEPIDYGARATEYRKGGWTRFDPKADPYRPNQTEIDRIRSRGYLDAA